MYVFSMLNARIQNYNKNDVYTFIAFISTFLLQKRFAETKLLLQYKPVGT